MQLLAVIIPPPPVLQDAFAAASTICLKPEELAAAPAEKGGVLQRLRKKAPEPEVVEVSLTVVPAITSFVRLARFGNVTLADSLALAETLASAAASWPSPVVHVAELDIDLTDTQLLIKAQLAGDTDSLRKIFGSFHVTAKRERFFLDRRSFRPEFDVASLELPDDQSVLERLDWDADSHVGPEWQATHISMMKVYLGPDGQTFEEIAQVPLGGGSAT